MLHLNALNSSAGRKVVCNVSNAALTAPARSKLYCCNKKNNIHGLCSHTHALHCHVPAGLSIGQAPRHSKRGGVTVASAGVSSRCNGGASDKFKHLLEVAKAAAESGASVVRDALDKPRNIHFKGTADLVTDTDKASEEAVLKVIRQHFPSHAVLGEEGGVSGDVNSEYLWCIDPLDGTTNFAHNYPSFAVSVGVLHRSTPVAACVIEFTGGPQAWATRTYTAHRGGGAFCNGRPIHVSSTADVTRSLLVTGFGYDHGVILDTSMALYHEMTDVSQGVRRLGAAAVDLCHVAMGLVEAYWEIRLKPWDVAAGVLICEEAGGKVTTMEGGLYTVFSRSMLASNGSVHGQLLERTTPKVGALRAAGVDLSSWFVPQGYQLQ